jgi:hypothetical protein
MLHLLPSELICKIYEFIIPLRREHLVCWYVYHTVSSSIRYESDLVRISKWNMLRNVLIVFMNVPRASFYNFCTDHGLDKKHKERVHHRYATTNFTYMKNRDISLEPQKYYEVVETSRRVTPARVVTLEKQLSSYEMTYYPFGKKYKRRDQQTRAVSIEITIKYPHVCRKHKYCCEEIPYRVCFKISHSLALDTVPRQSNTHIQN